MILLTPQQTHGDSLLAIMKVVLVVALLAVPVAIFSPWWQPAVQLPAGTESTQPDVTINMSILDSQAVQQLQSFPNSVRQFSYTAVDSAGKSVAGTIGAFNDADAKNQLQKMGLSAKTIREANVGRQEPFTPY